MHGRTRCMYRSLLPLSREDHLIRVSESKMRWSQGWARVARAGAAAGTRRDPIPAGLWSGDRKARVKHARDERRRAWQGENNARSGSSGTAVQTVSGIVFTILPARNCLTVWHPAQEIAAAGSTLSLTVTGSDGETWFVPSVSIGYHRDAMIVTVIGSAVDCTKKNAIGKVGSPSRSIRERK